MPSGAPGHLAAGPVPLLDPERTEVSARRRSWRRSPGRRRSRKTRGGRTASVLLVAAIVVETGRPLIQRVSAAVDASSFRAIGSRYSQTVSAIYRAPAALGCTPSSEIRSGLPSTPFIRNGTSGTPYFAARSSYIL